MIFPIPAEVTAREGFHSNWLAKCEGLDARFGHAVKFLSPVKKVGKATAHYSITEAGIYKHAPRTLTLLLTRRDTGFVRVTTTGAVEEITKEEALAAFNSETISKSSVTTPPSSTRRPYNLRPVALESDFRPKAKGAGRSFEERVRRTGCVCGSRENYSQLTDCLGCKFDSDDN